MHSIARKSNIVLGKAIMVRVLYCLILFLFFLTPFITHAQDGGEISANTCASVNSNFSISSLRDADFGGTPDEISYEWVISYSDPTGTISNTFYTSSDPFFLWEEVVAETEFTVTRVARYPLLGLGPEYSNTLVVNINPRMILATTSPKTCTNLTSFPVSYTFSGIPTKADQYSIEWSPEALSAGFVNVSKTTLNPSGGTIITQLPPTPTEANFNGLLKLHATTGCESSRFFIVEVYDPPELIITPPPAVCSPLKVDITTTVSSDIPGNPTFTYWKDNTATTSLSLTAAKNVGTSGTYYIRGKSSPGRGNCLSTVDPVVVIVKETPSAPTVSNGGAVCEGINLNLTASNVAGGSYTWLGPNGFSSSDQNPIINTAQTVASGTYSVTVTVNGCTSAITTTSAIVHSIPAPPIAGTGGAVCEGSNLQLTATEISGGIYAWQGPDGYNSVERNPIINTAQTSSSGAYSVTVTVNGCTSAITTTSATVHAIPAPPIAGTGGAVCEGSNLQLTATEISGGSYTWQGPDGYNSVERNPIINTAQTVASGTYSVTVTVNGCISAITATSATVRALPEKPEIYGSLSFCTGTSATLTSNIPNGIVWNTGETASSITVSNGGTYRVTVTDGNGCTNTSAAKEVRENLLPTAPEITGSASFCTGTSATLTSNIPNGIVWNTGETTSSITVSNGGIYRVTVTDGNGCTNTSAAKEVRENLLPTAPEITGAASFCTGTSATLTSNIPNGIVWNTGETASSITVSNGGIYRVTVTDGNGCTNTSAAKEVRENLLPTAPEITGAASFCTGTSATLTSNIPNGIVWNTGETASSITVSNGGIYRVTVTDGNGCTNTSAAKEVRENLLPTAPEITGSTSFCTGTSATLTSNIPNGIVWNTGETASSITVSNGGIYRVTVTDGNGCTNTSAAKEVRENLLPTAPEITGSTSFCTGTSATLTSNIPNGIVWNTGETASSITVSNGGTYRVTVTDGNGCTNTSAAKEVRENLLPTAPEITGAASFCTGTSATLTSNIPNGIVWNTGETASSITVSNGGIYRVTVTDGNGCTNTSAAKEVRENLLPTAPEITGAASFCTGTSATLTSNIPNGIVWNTGETASSITVSNGGTYRVTVTDGNGCTNTSAAKEVRENLLPTAPEITGSTSFCTGTSATLTSNIPNGIVWNTGETASSITVSNGGTYRVTVTDGNGCTNTSAAKEVRENLLPTAPEITGSTSFCTGTSATLTSNIPNGIVWSTGETASSITVSNGGTYRVTVTDGNGCTNTSAAKEVRENLLPTAPEITGSTSFCTGTSATLTSNIPNGIVWNTGETASSITVSNSGTYRVTVTDGNGCTNTSAAKEVRENLLPTAPEITGSTSFCTGTSATLTSNIPNGIVWSTGETASSITVSNGGTYRVTVTDGNGCTNTSAAKEVRENLLPTAPEITGSTSFCTGTSATLTSNIPNGIVWSTGETASSITVSNGGTYRVTVTDGNGCTNTSAAKEVRENLLPTAPEITGSTSFCTGTSATLTSNIPNGIVWNTGETASSITVSNGGTYRVTVTDGNGCTNTSAAKEVTMNPLPSAPVISGRASFCSGKSTTLESTVADAYLWNTGAITRSITVIEEGNYSVIITNNNGCKSASQSIPVTVNPSPTVQITNPPAVCVPAVIDLTNNAVTNGSAKNLEYTYWHNESATEPVINPAVVKESGICYIRGTIASTGCSDTRMVSVNIHTIPVFTVNNPSPVCEPATIDLTEDAVINTNSSGLTYSFWSDADNTIPLQNPSAIKYGGTFYVKVVGPAGCSASLPVLAEVYPMPSGALHIPTAHIICEGSVIELKTESNADRFQWYKDDVLIANANSAIYPAVSAGTYSVAFVSKAGCMKSMENNIRLDFIRKPGLNIKIANNCEGKDVQFTNLSSFASSGNISWLWDFGNGSSSTSFSASSIYNEPGMYSVSLKAINATCPSLTVTKHFSVTIETPRTGMRYKTIDAIAGAEFRLSARNFGYRYRWKPPFGLNNTSIATPLGKLQKDTMYTVEITSAAGCETVDTVSVDIHLLGDIYMPDAFTPNSDGKNDLLYPNLTGIQTFRYLRIYNRWGKLVFQTNHASPTMGWDGKKNGIMQPGGAYVWIAEGVDYGGNIIRRNGIVLLLQ